MKINVLNNDGKDQSLEISEKIFSNKVNLKLIAHVMYTNKANANLRLAKTKQKNEIKGSTAKIYAQKGTGNARHASRKAPIFVGGGVAHGPKGGGNYKIRKLNKKERSISLISILSKKNKDKHLYVIEDFKNQIKKTKDFNNLLKKFKFTNPLFVLDDMSKKNINLCSRNIKGIKSTTCEHLNSYDLIKYKQTVFTISSIKKIEERFK
tara:strand:- start:760 stop:1383 length:624 start_codon:yes stop_codon:yes gene_type:complete